jgi:dGTPase
LIDRQDIEKRERQMLAPYAALSAETRGRRYPQPEHPLRTAYQRDRDRIVHSAAFRRMEYKTQVFVPHEADHFRTRLTHSIEVAQVSRTLARNLRLNEDLTEAIALVHDLGHTPFGHSGEDALDELLKNHGGFNHNRQSLRVVDILEHRYPDHPGLNLTYEVREGIIKHETKVRLVTDEFHPDEHPTLEASLVDAADELTYSAHDIDDGLNSGLLTRQDIAPLTIWQGYDEAVWAGRESTADNDKARYQLVRFLVNSMATDLMTETSQQLDLQEITDVDSLRGAAEPVCRYSDDMREKVRELKAFLQAQLYHHPRLNVEIERAKGVVRFLFEKLTARPELMPPRFQAMLQHETTPIVVADYIAGMTDRFAENLKRSLEK